MPREPRRKEKSSFVDERALRRAKWGLKSEAQVVRMAVEQICKVRAFWRFMKRSRGRLKPGSIDLP